MIDRGLEILATEGIEVGVPHLSIERVVRDLDLPRSSAYRPWVDDEMTPQECFRRQVLLSAIRGDASAGEKARMEAELAAHIPLPAEPAPADPDRVRVAAAAAYAALKSSPGWRHHLVVLTIAGRTARTDPELLEAAREAERRTIARYSELYHAYAVHHGLRLRPGITIEHFTTLLGSLFAGLELRDGLNENLEIDLPDSDGTIRRHPLFVVGLEALMSRCFEPDPQARAGNPARVAGPADAEDGTGGPDRLRR